MKIQRVEIFPAVLPRAAVLLGSARRRSRSYCRTLRVPEANTASFRAELDAPIYRAIKQFLK